MIGQLVEDDELSAVVAVDGAERVMIARASIASARRRFPPKLGASADASGADGAPTRRPEEEADATMPLGYIGLIARPMICAVKCEGVLMSFGPELGYYFLGGALRFAIKDGGTVVSPDVRLYYEFGSEIVNVAPAFELSPTFASADGLKVFQLVVRPSLRIAFAPTEGLAVFVEPVALDLGVYTHASSGRQSATSEDVVVRYDLAFGAQYRF